MIEFHQQELLLQWDSQIGGVCSKINSIIDDIATAGIKLTVA